jgi:hypothetical protein
MVEQSRAVVGVFTFMDDALQAVAKVKESKLDYRVYAPTYRWEIEEATDSSKSPVRIVSLTGGIIGCASGFLLAILTSLDWPMRTSAKEIVSVPAFFVPGYEWTILFGGLSTLGAMMYLCKIPNVLRTAGYDPRFSNDKFGVVVACSGNQVEGIKKSMLDSGADEVDVRESL